MQKRWIGGVLILAVLLGAGLWIGCSMQRWHTPVAYDLEQAAQAALEGDMGRAQEAMRRAGRSWRRCYGLTAAVMDHAPREEVDSIFHQLESYAEAGDRVAFAAWCSRAASLVRALGEANSFTWKNLL